MRKQNTTQKSYFTIFVSDLHRILGFVKRTTERHVLSISQLNLWQSRCFFRGPERWKSLGVQSGLYDVCVQDTLKQADIRQAVWGFSTKWPSSWPSEEASWRSQIPNWCRSIRQLLAVFPFTKPRILWWSHTFTDHVVTFRVTVWRSGSFVFFLMTNVILTKKL